jgi:hypothetical protein
MLASSLVSHIVDSDFPFAAAVRFAEFWIGNLMYALDCPDWKRKCKFIIPLPLLLIAELHLVFEFKVIITIG